MIQIRPARTSDVREIRNIIDSFSTDGSLLSKATVTIFENIQEFLVAAEGDRIIGCGALHVMWEDLAEVRTLAVVPDRSNEGIGSQLLEQLLDKARALGIRRVFCLTFRKEFFGHHGFVEIENTPVGHEVYEQLLQSFDEGVAEFLGLERVKPNTLGNFRMLNENI
ncbi:MAG: amino-acid N-acetyltransferase [Candidatus Nanopelagicales bacterium]|jgi:amino-acid N-acetyltransferase|nr:amino-acid N-acetyltransferase [Actinomycetes bacterium]MCH9841377.1 amino-acid N-acetyltransferase [Actinomycetes bacterium]